MSGSRFDEIAARFMAKVPTLPTSPASIDGGDEAVVDPFVGLLERLRVPKKYLAVKRETVLHPAIAGWRGEPWCVTLLGNAGTGKTWQAVRLLAAVYAADERRFVWSKHRSFYVDWSTAIEQIKREFSTDERGVTFDELCRAELLLIDDFGAERETAFSLDQASLILRARYNEQRPTILTSNLPSLEPIAAAEPRIASRLFEGVVLPIEGRDRRRLPQRPPRPEVVR